MTLLDDTTDANLELEALRSAGWKDRQIAALGRVKEHNRRVPLELTPEAAKLDWLRWMVATRHLDPKETVTPLPHYTKELPHDYDRAA